jgi:YD repeat-containing protein
VSQTLVTPPVTPQTTNYTYDYENKLTKVEATVGGVAQTEEMKYNADGLRVEKTVPENGGE